MDRISDSSIFKLNDCRVLDNRKMNGKVSKKMKRVKQKETTHEVRLLFIPFLLISESLIFHHDWWILLKKKIKKAKIPSFCSEKNLRIKPSFWLVCIFRKIIWKRWRKLLELNKNKKKTNQLQDCILLGMFLFMVEKIDKFIFIIIILIWFESVVFRDPLHVWLPQRRKNECHPLILQVIWHNRFTFIYLFINSYHLSTPTIIAIFIRWNHQAHVNKYQYL